MTQPILVFFRVIADAVAANHALLQELEDNLQKSRSWRDLLRAYAEACHDRRSAKSQRQAWSAIIRRLAATGNDDRPAAR